MTAPVKTLLFVILLFVRTVWAMFRRLTLGPRRPGWNVPAELAQTAVRTSLFAARWWGFQWLRGLQSLAPSRSPVLEQVDFESVDAAGVPCEWCRPKDAAPERTLVYLHGGGYVLGSVDSYRELIARLAIGARAQVLAPNYRLAPEHRFPAASDDCVGVYRWLLGQGEAAEGIALAGDSAGGGLCLDLLCSVRDAGDPLPAAALLFSPWVDPQAKGGSLVSQERFDAIDRIFLDACIATYMDGRAADDPRVAPLRAELSGLPPLMIAVGTCEVLLDQDRELAERANQAGVDATLATYEDCFHSFQAFASFIPTAAHAIADGCHFLQVRVSARNESRAAETGTPS